MFGRKTRTIKARDARIATLENQLADAKEDIGTAVFFKERAIQEKNELTGHVTELEAQLQTSRNLNAQLNSLRTASVTVQAAR